ncbi:MAG TPA: hypothetical protein VJN94_01650 [Candidatus Binataceae bacterium]|nr:hypothetical protein [Candidatus Binataceae bacterium]
MLGKRAIVMVGAGALMVAVAAAGRASAQGFGARNGGHEMWLLARAAGLNKTQVMSGFQGDTNLQTDRTTLKSAHQAMLDCLLSANSGTSCTSQIAAYASAKSALEQERMTVWAGLFKTAPNLSQAASVRSQLEQLHKQRQAIVQQVFGAAANNASSSTSSGGSTAE